MFITGRKSGKGEKEVIKQKVKVQMRTNVRNSDKGAKRFLGQLAAEKKKTVTALGLIAVMALMWIRVLSRKAPEAAEAQSTTGQVEAEDPSNPEPRMFFVGLPKVSGRNDAIARDFFASDGWRHFLGGGARSLAGIEEVNVVSKGGSEEVVRKVAEKLKLQAIGLGENPRAFINNKMVSAGDKVLIGDGVDKYECEVVQIKANTVVIRYGEAEITLKLMQVIENGG